MCTELCNNIDAILPLTLGAAFSTRINIAVVSIIVYTWYHYQDLHIYFDETQVKWTGKIENGYVLEAKVMSSVGPASLSCLAHLPDDSVDISESTAMIDMQETLYSNFEYTFPLLGAVIVRIAEVEVDHFLI